MTDPQPSPHRAPRRKRKKAYRLSDLIAIAEQMGGRLHISIVPAELLPAPPEPHREQE